MSRDVDVVIVVGSPTSSNSNRLAELARKLGVPSYMVDSPCELKAEWLAGKARVGLTAGASAPEVLVQDVIDRIKALGAVSVRKMDGVVETVKFPMPGGPEALNRADVEAAAARSPRTAAASCAARPCGSCPAARWASPAPRSGSSWNSCRWGGSFKARDATACWPILFLPAA